MHFVARGCLAAAASRFRALTSQSATMFSEETDPRLLPPRPPAPMIALLSRLFRVWPRRNAGAAVAAPAAAISAPVNWRRVMRLDFMEARKSGVWQLLLLLSR